MICKLGEAFGIKVVRCDKIDREITDNYEDFEFPDAKVQEEIYMKVYSVFDK